MSLAIPPGAVVEISAELVSTTDNRCQYFTISASPINPYIIDWPDKSVVCPSSVGQVVYKKTFFFSPGPNTIWVAISPTSGVWVFKIRAKIAATGKVIAEINDLHDASSLVNSYTINLSKQDIPLTPIMAAGADPSATVKQLVETVMPPMVHAMGMVMMTHMVVSLIQSMAVAFAGGV
jgi:hypothetical protein